MPCTAEGPSLAPRGTATGATLEYVLSDDARSILVRGPAARTSTPPPRVAVQPAGAALDGVRLEHDAHGLTLIDTASRERPAVALSALPPGDAAGSANTAADETGGVLRSSAPLKPRLPPLAQDSVSSASATLEATSDPAIKRARQRQRVAPAVRYVTPSGRGGQDVSFDARRGELRMVPVKPAR